MAEFQAYSTQQMKADVRIQANEWPEPNPAGRYLTPAELDTVLLNRYPSRGEKLREALSTRWGVTPEQLIFGNGSNETLLYTFLVFGGHGRRTLLFQPTYAMHGRLSVIAGGTVVDELIGLPYELTATRAHAAMSRARPEIVVFTTPNNPTGNEIDDGVILSVAERYPETVVLVDEAYSDFAGTTLLPHQADHPNLVLSKTFSKVRAAAGLRLGVLVVHPDLAGYYRALQLPYNISALTYAVGSRIAQDDDGIARRVALATRERARMFAALKRVPQIDVFPSVTNFILFRLHDGDVKGTHARFLAESVLIRDISMWAGCAGCLRASIGTPEENDRFIAALDKVFASPVVR